MVKKIGWVLLITNLVWFALIPLGVLYAETEPSLHAALAGAASLIAGAILIVGGSK